MALAPKVFGYCLVYGLVDASFEAAGNPKRIGHHLLASTCAAAYIHVATLRTTVGVPRAVGLGFALGVISSPLYWLMFETDYIDPKPKSIRELTIDGVELLKKTLL